MDISKVKKLVGNITPEQLKYVDCYVGGRSGIFIPAAGQCGYALTQNHTHPTYAFVILTNDSLEISANNSTTIVKGSNAMVAMSPDFVHHEKKSDTFVRYYAIFIERELFESTLQLYRNETLQFQSEVFSLSIDLLPIIKSYISEYSDKLPGYKEQLRFLEERLTHLIIRNILEIKTSDQLISNRFEIDKALEYISNNYMNKLTLALIADQVNYSPSHFSRIFKKEVGLTLPAYINSIRLKMAKKKIQSGLENMSEIAFSCGFATASHFSAAFKKEFNQSPSNYAAMMGKKAKI